MSSETKAATFNTSKGSLKYFSEALVHIKKHSKLGKLETGQIIFLLLSLSIGRLRSSTE